MPVLILAMLGCGAGAPAPRKVESVNSETAGARAKAKEPDPKQALSEADTLYTDQLGAQGRDDRYGTDRQVAALRRAISLYEEFIERAEGDPRFDAAVRRSQERIEDARLTIIFLLGEDEE